MIINSVTKLYTPGGVISESLIQEHLDAQNADGFVLVAVDNMGGWYRFFWSKETE